MLLYLLSLFTVLLTPRVSSRTVRSLSSNALPEINLGRIVYASAQQLFIWFNFLMCSVCLESNLSWLVLISACSGLSGSVWITRDQIIRKMDMFDCRTQDW